MVKWHERYNRITGALHIAVDCPVCDRRVKTYVPKDGDGSGRRPYRHKDDDGKWCDGRFEEV